MHGQKKRRKRSLNGDFKVDDACLAWELASEPQWTTDGCKGLCVRVQNTNGAHRELTIEFPYDHSSFVPQRPKLTAAIVEAETRLAIANGWDPQSRGRTILHMAATKLQSDGRAAGNPIAASRTT